ncbi:hypothetical protein TWF694_005529 [Orbilia ellipsospora]|uniref:NAD(P)-binding protein n=1 Tax=Orbilia ellipsospora TaxID=2528407 RepID=A0AAV9WTE7_9PEZI
MATVNVGVIGYGPSTTALHIPTIAAVPNAKLYALVQCSTALEYGSARKGEHVTVDYPNVRHYHEAAEIFKDRNVHLIVLCSPNLGTCDLAKDALVHGKHVIVEKPVYLTPQDYTSLISLANKYNLLLTVYQNRRWDSDFLTLRKYLTAPHIAPLLNPIISITSQFNCYRLPTTPSGSASGALKSQDLPSNGMLYDLGSHLIDQMLYLFGLPDWLWAHKDNQRQTEPLGIDDSFTIYMYYSAKPDFNYGKPLTIELKSSMVSPLAPQNRWIVKSWQGGYQKYGTDVQEDQLRVHGLEALNEKGYGEENIYEWPELTVPSRAVGTGEEALSQIFGKIAFTKRAGDYVSGTVQPEKGDYVEYYRNVIWCVGRVLSGEGAKDVKEDLHVKPEEARNTSGVIELAVESAKTGNRVDVKGRLKF